MSTALLDIAAALVVAARDAAAAFAYFFYVWLPLADVYAPFTFDDHAVSIEPELRAYSLRSRFNARRIAFSLRWHEAVPLDELWAVGGRITFRLRIRRQGLGESVHVAALVEFGDHYVGSMTPRLYEAARYNQSVKVNVGSESATWNVGKLSGLTLAKLVRSALSLAAEPAEPAAE